MSAQGRMEIITTEDSGRWDEVLDEIGVFSFYHLSSYHRLAEMSGEGRAIMPVFRRGDCTIAFPLLERQIEIPGVVSACDGLKDATSVRGFAGPISRGRIPDDAVSNFRQELDDLLRGSCIVSVYSRLNPFMTPHALLDGFGETVPVGVTVSLDLTDPSDMQFARYRDSHRYEIRRLRKLGYVCEEVGPAYIDDFMRIYYDAMDRVGARRRHYYDKWYIEYLLTEMPGVMHLFICRQGDMVVSASIETACCGTLESYLGGTSTEFLPLAPDKLVYDTVREWGTKSGAKTFHLGGGMGAQRDSLYDFKMGFGGREHVYSTWRHVVDHLVYDDLSSEAARLADPESLGTYFPAYRSPCLSPVELEV